MVSTVTELYMKEGTETVRKTKLQFDFVQAGSESETTNASITVGSHDFGRLLVLLEREFVLPNEPVNAENETEATHMVET